MIFVHAVAHQYSFRHPSPPLNYKPLQQYLILSSIGCISVQDRKTHNKGAMFLYLQRISILILPMHAQLYTRTRDIDPTLFAGGLTFSVFLDCRFANMLHVHPIDAPCTFALNFWCIIMISLLFFSGKNRSPSTCIYKEVYEYSIKQITHIQPS